MRGSIRAATAIGVGYVLGRRRKLRTAALLAAATAVGGKSVGGLILEGWRAPLRSAEWCWKTAGLTAASLDAVADWHDTAPACLALP
jgi:hypothetical protein